MSNLLIALIVIYIITVIIQIGYCIAWYNNDTMCHNPSAIRILIFTIIFAPIMILLEIGVGLFYIKK